MQRAPQKFTSYEVNYQASSSFDLEVAKQPLQGQITALCGHNGNFGRDT